MGSRSRTRTFVAAGALVLSALGASACGDDGAGELAGKQVERSLQVSSPAIENGGEFPTRFTCDGDDVLPPLEWSDAGGDSYLVLLIDPDADDFVHWILYDIPGDVTGLEEGVVPEGAKEGENSFGSTGYRGPCPPGDEEHRYTFVVYASKGNVDFGDLKSPSAAEIDDAVACCLSARGELRATYGGRDQGS
ncbi:MAG: YbhB/YbcL family Raf kinase inhibitor-like protein [Actinobacteria bacterium]|nr:YbhB/YbcL family Raf kinase inhibitor-like protein [Actinomycetota bacterium]